MALQGPAVGEMSWESQPSGFHCKAVSANWAPPHQGCRMNVPKRPRAKCGEGAEEALEMFECHHAWSPPAHQSMYSALMLSRHPLPILTLTLCLKTPPEPQKKGSKVLVQVKTWAGAYLDAWMGLFLQKCLKGWS